jgi:hypothetical protein
MREPTDRLEVVRERPTRWPATVRAGPYTRHPSQGRTIWSATTITR